MNNILGHYWRVYVGYPNAGVAMQSQFLIQRHNLTSCCSLQNSPCLVKFILKKEIFQMYLCTVCDIKAMALATYFCSIIFVTNVKLNMLNTLLSRMITCVIVYLSKRWRELLWMVEKCSFCDQSFWYDGVIVEFMLRVQICADLKK